jgi:hypothetical protein
MGLHTGQSKEREGDYDRPRRTPLARPGRYRAHIPALSSGPAL